MQRKGHVLVVAYPLQGHAAPLLKLSRRIAEHGIQVTFAIAEQERERMLTAMPDFEEANQLIKLVSVPDGSKSGYDRKVGRNLAESFHAMIPSYLDGLLSKDCTGITGVIFDPALSCFVGIPKKMGLKTAVSWTSTPGCLALGLKIQKLLEDRVIDENGKYRCFSPI
ncbi:hypothetical protein LIER_36353 [Lithospermum erythrorhizon]|uniref:Uncharacterized protein n=1 Tax=Lithospermum erythrorhizon TaxID=34254 RepID=A0AAV3P7E7_LITER